MLSIQSFIWLAITKTLYICLTIVLVNLKTYGTHLIYCELPKLQQCNLRRYVTELYATVENSVWCYFFFGADYVTFVILTHTYTCSQSLVKHSHNVKSIRPLLFCLLILPPDLAFFWNFFLFSTNLSQLTIEL